MSTIYKEISCKNTPAEIFERIYSGKYSILLESARHHPKIGRYSFLGIEPFLIFKSKGNEVEIKKLEIGNWKLEKKIVEKPLDELKKLMKEYQTEKLDGIPNFVGGAVGYISYDYCHFFEKLPKTVIDDLKIPDLYFMFYNTIIAFDHFKNKVFIIGRKESKEKIEELEYKINNPTSHCSLLTAHCSHFDYSIKSTFTKEEFEFAVIKCKEYIKAGDIYQANLSQRLDISFNGNSWELYKILREINPSPFAAYLDLDKIKIVSCSPERLLKVIGDEVETRPIAGTRPRGDTREDDKNFAKELILSEKERAEHIMLVDLERNDIGRVCEYRTVRVDELMTTEKYSHVFHIVSNVRGKLYKGFDRFDLIKACFPGGTITGCPKIRCMEIIDELEPTARGIYTGSIGYLSFNGDMDLNIVIRTFVIKDGKAYIQVGAGIVYDSEPEKEYYETLYKAEALIKAIEKLQGRPIKNFIIKKFKPNA